MAKIFVSHSRKDEDIIGFFLKAFAGTNVKPHLEELEKEPPTGVNAQKIGEDIQQSNAVFVLLSENVQSLQHTRDWVNWECGSAQNKEIWVFEPLATLGKIQVVVPRFNHYVLFENTEDWRRYIRGIVESYDDSHVIPTLSVATGAGAVLNEKDRGAGALGGFALGFVGLLLQNMTKPSFGISVKCCKCQSNYCAHRYGRMRCAVCNADLILQPLHEPEFRTAGA